MVEPGIEESIRAWAAKRRLPAAHLARWLGLADADRRSLLELAQALNLRTGQFVTAFAMLDEIGVREGTTIAAVLARREIRQVRAMNESAPGKARALLDTLRAMRFPRLRTTTERIANGVAKLGLPAGVRVVLPPDLSSAELRVELTAHGSADLRRLLDALAERGTELCRIADQLGGVDEV